MNEQPSLFPLRLLRDLSGTAGGESQQIKIVRPLRYLPGRREVFEARWNGQAILAKVFRHPTKTAKHAWHDWDSHVELHRRGVNTPKPLWIAETSDHGLVVASQFLPGARTLSELSQDERRSLIPALLKLVRDCHEAGFLQRDLHLGNVLLHELRLYMIDAAGGIFQQGALNEKAKIANLALLAANIDLPLHQAWDEAFPSYEPDGEAGEALLKKVREAVPRAIQRRARNFLAKTQRTCSAFISESWPGGKSWRTRSCPESLFRRLSQYRPKEPLGRMIKPSSRVHVFEIEEEGKSYVVKCHWHETWFERLFHCFGHSRARRSWMAGLGLRHFGLDAPEPLACWEFRSRGLPVADLLLMGKVLGQPLQEFVREVSPFRARVASSCRMIFQVLGELRATHGDTKASNFLVGQEGKVWLIDFDATKLCRGLFFGRGRREDLRRFRQNGQKYPEGQDIFSL